MGSSSGPSGSHADWRQPRCRCSGRSAPGRSGAGCGPRSIRMRARSSPHCRRPTPAAKNSPKRTRGRWARSDRMGPLPHRRRAARHVLDRQLATDRRIADVHGCAARPLERGAHRRGHVRADPARAVGPRDRGRGDARPRRSRAASPLRSVRDGAPAPSAGRDGQARGGAGGRPLRGAPERLRDCLRARSRRPPASRRRGVEHAARARLELHRMYGQQAAAFTFTLPLCRGLR